MLGGYLFSRLASVRKGRLTHTRVVVRSHESWVVHECCVGPLNRRSQELGDLGRDSGTHDRHADCDAEHDELWPYQVDRSVDEFGRL